MQKLFIIIAEDDADDRFLLQTAFNENGFKDDLHFIPDGYELMEYLKTHKNVSTPSQKLDFILLDLNMPKKNGREVLAEMNADPILKQIPVVVFSTTSNDTERKRCFELGAKAYVTKPVTFAALIQSIVEIRGAFVGK